MKTFDALYLQPNNEGVGHFVYNIDTMQRNLVCRVIGINKKHILMTDLMIDLINRQARREQKGMKFTNTGNNAIVKDY